MSVSAWARAAACSASDLMILGYMVRSFWEPCQADDWIPHAGRWLVCPCRARARACRPPPCASTRIAQVGRDFGVGPDKIHFEQGTAMKKDDTERARRAEFVYWRAKSADACPGVDMGPAKGARQLG